MVNWGKFLERFCSKSDAKIGITWESRLDRVRVGGVNLVKARGVFSKGRIDYGPQGSFYGKYQYLADITSDEFIDTLEIRHCLVGVTFYARTLLK